MLVDILRCYETSWLEHNGKPNIACIEIISQDSIDTLQLKSFLNELNNFKFDSIQGFIDEINSKYNIVNLKQLDFTGLLSTTIQPSHMFRFLCKQTGQPHFGGVRIFDENNNLIKVDIEAITTKLRNFESTPYEFASILHEEIDAPTISCHFTRKGGISIQSIRSKFDLDYSALISREAIE